MHIPYSNMEPSGVVIEEDLPQPSLCGSTQDSGLARSAVLKPDTSQSYSC